MFEGLTNKGREYVAKCLANETPVTFVKVKIGNGSLGDDEDPTTFTDIKSLKKEVDIAEKSQVEDTVRLLVQLDNAGLEEGYFPREIGIYVQDGKEEILYWYINDGTETSWLPPASKSPVKLKYWINLMATNVETVIVNWTGKELWVDREFLAKEMVKKANKDISITGTGALEGGGNLEENRVISHKDTKGYKHIPLGGAAKQFLKWASDGIAKWGALLWEEIEGKPSSMKNPYSITIKQNGGNAVSYDGGTVKEIDITTGKIGAEPAFTKKSGFNLEKSDSVNSDSSETLATSLAVKKAYDKANAAFPKGSLPEKIADAKTMADIIEKNLGLKVDWNQMFLTRRGVKTKDCVYFDENKPGAYICIKTTPEDMVINSTEYFVDISNYQLSHKLENLFKEVEVLAPIDLKKGQTINIDFSQYSNFKFINFYTGYYDKQHTGSLYVKISIKDLLLSSQNVSLAGSEEGSDYIITLNNITCFDKTVIGGGDPYKFIRLTASYI